MIRAAGLVVACGVVCVCASLTLAGRPGQRLRLFRGEVGDPAGAPVAAAVSGGVARGLGPPFATPFPTPSWARWNAMRFDGAPGSRLRLAEDITGRQIAKSSWSVKITIRARFEPNPPGVNQTLIEVGDNVAGYALGYDHALGQLVFGVHGASHHASRWTFVADGQWHDFDVEYLANFPAGLFIDGVLRPHAFSEGASAPLLAMSGAATVAGNDGVNPLSGLPAPEGAGDWTEGPGVDTFAGDIAYLRIERDNVGVRSLEMYFNQGSGAPVDYAGGVIPTVIGPANWITIDPPHFIYHWPMSVQGDEYLHSGSVFTDETLDPLSPVCTVPQIVDAPGGGKALRCRVFLQDQRHSEWRCPIPYPNPRDIYIAWDQYIDSATLTNAGNPYSNWFYWFRAGEGEFNNPAVFVGHFDHDGDGVPGIRTVVQSGPIFNVLDRLPFDQWNRLMVRYRVGRDNLGVFALSDGLQEWSSATVSKSDTFEFRIRARAGGSSGTLFLRNVSLGTDPQEVFFGEPPGDAFRGCGRLAQFGPCIVFESDDGSHFALDDTGSYSVGDRVWVEGELRADCDTGCPGVAGCIEDNTINSCVAGCGAILAPVGACTRVRLSDGREFTIENVGAFGPGDHVYVAGMVDPLAISCSQPPAPPLIHNLIDPGVNICGLLAEGSQGCPVLVSSVGEIYLIENSSAFTTGARIYVEGRYNPTSLLCGTIVRQAIEDNTVVSCSPDLNADGHVNAADLALLLGAWGQQFSPADVSGDGVVGAADLGMLLGAWSG